MEDWVSETFFFGGGLGGCLYMVDVCTYLELDSVSGLGIGVERVRVRKETYEEEEQPLSIILRLASFVHSRRFVAPLSLDPST